MSVENKQYVCEVMLPERSPIRSAIGTPSSRKAIAKRSAAFEACLLLRKGGHLDEHLIPTLHKRLPRMRNAQLALNMNKKEDTYGMRLKPDLWEEQRGTRPTELYVTILNLEKPENLGRPCQPIAILTRTRLPDFPPFCLYLQVGKASDLLCNSFGTSFNVTDSTLAALTEYTLRTYLDIFNKEFEENQTQMSYWFAPILKNQPMRVEAESPEHLIDWSLVESVRSNKEVRWTVDTPHSQLMDRFLVDRWDGERRFYSVKVVPGMGPLDKVPEDAAVWTNSKDKRKGAQDIWDYTVRLYSKPKAKARESREFMLNQPVVLAHRTPLRRNWLEALAEDEKKVETKSYLLPEPLLISMVSKGSESSFREKLTNF